MRTFSGSIGVGGVKYSGSISDGKIGCCCSCCLYPWPDPTGSPKYPDTDLPAKIATTVTLDKGINPAVTTTPPSYVIAAGNYVYQEESVPGAGVGDTIWADASGVWKWASFDTTVSPWTLITGPSDGPCLIGTEGATDFFNPTYTVTDGTTTDTVTNPNPFSTCTWTGAHFTLSYNATTFKWVVSGPTSGAKNPPQSSPVGSYTNGITVS